MDGYCVESWSLLVKHVIQKYHTTLAFYVSPTHRSWNTCFTCHKRKTKHLILHDKWNMCLKINVFVKQNQVQSVFLKVDLKCSTNTYRWWSTSWTKTKKIINKLETTSRPTRTNKTGQQTQQIYQVKITNDERNKTSNTCEVAFCTSPKSLEFNGTGWRQKEGQVRDSITSRGLRGEVDKLYTR